MTATLARPTTHRLIQTAEDLLALRDPGPGPYWPGEAGNTRDNTFDNVRWDSLQFNLLSDRGGEYAVSTDEGILAIDPDFRQKALLDAIEEVLTFARLFLSDESPTGDLFRFQNVHLQDEVRAVCRRHLMKLLGRWYELEGTDTPGGAA